MRVEQSGMLSIPAIRDIVMPKTTLAKNGKIVIPAEIRARYKLTAGMQIDFVDEGGAIRLLIRRHIPESEPIAGFGLVKVKRTKSGSQRRLAE